MYNIYNLMGPEDNILIKNIMVSIDDNRVKFSSSDLIRADYLIGLAEKITYLIDSNGRYDELVITDIVIDGDSIGIVNSTESEEYMELYVKEDSMYIKMQIHEMSIIQFISFMYIIAKNTSICIPDGLDLVKQDLTITGIQKFFASRHNMKDM